MIDLKDAETIPRPTLIPYRDSIHDDYREDKLAAVVGLPDELAPTLAAILGVLEGYGSEHHRCEYEHGTRYQSLAEDLILVLRRLGH